MRVLCENMLVPTKFNWIDLLRVTDILHLPRLKLEIKTFLRDNLDLVRSYAADAVHGVNEEFPGLLEDILQMRWKSFPLPPSKILMDQVETSTKLAEQAARDDMSIPWEALLVIAVSAFLYQFVIRAVALGPLIPIINMIFVGSLVYYLRAHL